MLQCVVEYYVCCSVMLQCVAEYYVCCSVMLQCVAHYHNTYGLTIRKRIYTCILLCVHVCHYVITIRYYDTYTYILRYVYVYMLLRYVYVYIHVCYYVY